MSHGGKRQNGSRTFVAEAGSLLILINSRKPT
jgi:hypothetical protein